MISSFDNQLADCFSVTFITGNYVQVYRLIKTNEPVLVGFETSTGISQDNFLAYLEEERAFLLTVKSTPAKEVNEMGYFKSLVKLWECK